MALLRNLIYLLILQAVSGQEAPKKLTEFLKKKFADYDSAMRPNHGGTPVTVTVSGYVLDISPIDEKSQDFTVSLYLRHEWKDARLEFTETEAGQDKIQLTKEYADKLWKVDTFIVNERESKGHDLLTENVFTRISTDGTVLTSSRFTIRATCKMELGWFPFDRHTCPLLLESYAHTTKDFVYQWKADSNGNIKTAVGVAPEVTSIQFNIPAVNCRKESETVGSVIYSRLAVEFFFIRSATRYVHQVYFPAILVTLLAFVTLLHETGTTKSRLQISILLEGLLIVLIALSSSNMPPVNYQTALDFYLMICLLTVLFVVAVNVAFCLVINTTTNDTNGIVRLRSVYDNNHVEDEGKEVLFDTGANLSPRTNRIFTLLVKLRLGIPLVFIVFNVIYWMVVLIGSSSFPEDFMILGKNVNY
ncbi:Gamma-aminobutyric acid receptor subunit beta [Orchesella cincta]|uniref:Gamma-aminobutyric acid receptor subunit beta n=1 Tax=Orchesella cincta TaxID=48709 RepID=A0A1D2MQY4_ORCCI|nr:Gamma-aminobutyric acid receptor subunit beta [Orchesella cincta]